MSNKPWYDQSKPEGETPAQLFERLKREKQQRDKIREATQKLAEKPKTRAEQIEAEYQAKLDSLKRDFKYASSDAERAKLADGIKMYENTLAEHQAKMREESRQAKFRDSELYGRMKDSADAVARSGGAIYPAVSIEDRELLVSIVRSVDLFDTPEEMFAAYRAQQERVESVQLSAEQRKQAELSQAAAAAELAAAKQSVRTLEAEARAAKAGGDQ